MNEHDFCRRKLPIPLGLPEVGSPLDEHDLIACGCAEDQVVGIYSVLNAHVMVEDPTGADGGIALLVLVEIRTKIDIIEIQFQRKGSLCVHGENFFRLNHEFLCRRKVIKLCWGAKDRMGILC